MPANYRVLRRQLDRQLHDLEDRYLALRDLKSDGALGGQTLSVVVMFDDTVESVAAAMQHLRDAIYQLDLQSKLWDEEGVDKKRD